LNALFSLLEKTTGLPLQRTYHPQRSVDVDHVVVNGQRASEQLGWKARTSMEKGLDDTWNWFRATQL
jgi:UDP-glucose 4-epimerase